MDAKLNIGGARQRLKEEANLSWNCLSKRVLANSQNYLKAWTAMGLNK
jgi:hypothetical protein